MNIGNYDNEEQWKGTFGGEGTINGKKYRGRPTGNF